MPHRLVRATGTAVTAAALLALPACGTSAPVAEPAPPSRAAPGPTEPGAADTPQSAATSAAPDQTVVDLTVVGGEVSGAEDRVQVPLGQAVVLRVSSDVADEVHVHGYDLYLDLVPGQTAELPFTAEIPGVFELELHDSGLQLPSLQVS